MAKYEGDNPFELEPADDDSQFETINLRQVWLGLKPYILVQVEDDGRIETVGTGFTPKEAAKLLRGVAKGFDKQK